MVSKNYKKLIWIVITVVVLIGITFPMLLFCDAVGARVEIDTKGMFRGMSVWFEVLITFLVTISGFFFATQFNGILEKNMDVEKENEVWTTGIKLSLREIKDKLFEDASIARLMVLCSSLLKICEIDSIAASTLRRSSFYRRILFILTQLSVLPIKENDLYFSRLSDFNNINSGESKKLVEAICEWIICLVFLESIDFSKYRWFENAEIATRIKKELEIYFCFSEYLDGSEETISKGYEIRKEIINKLSDTSDVKEYLYNEAKHFCGFLKSGKKKCDILKEIRN